MKYELTRDLIEEICCCIVDCGMSREEACDYALQVAASAVNAEDAEVVG